MNTWTRAARRVFSQPAFLAAVALLAISALGMNAAVGYLKLQFMKAPCALRTPLLQGIPARMGDWVQVSRDQPLDPELEQALGTSKYVFRDYVDTSIVTPEEVESLKGANGNLAEYQQLRQQIEDKRPEAFVTFAVTYYTGMVDSVIHVPERCYVADGYEVSKADDNVADLSGAGWHQSVPYRFLSFEDQTGTRRVARNVGYFFHADGAFVGSVVGVRMKLQDLRERYGYYAKVEMMTQMPSTHGVPPEFRANSAKSMERLMAASIPYVEKCLPDWQALHQKSFTHGQTR
jgi:hypothetical protein